MVTRPFNTSILAIVQGYFEHKDAYHGYSQDPMEAHHKCNMQGIEILLMKLLLIVMILGTFKFIFGGEIPAKYVIRA